MALTMLSACKKNTWDSSKDIPENIQMVNAYIDAYCKDAYLWIDRVNTAGIDPSKEPNPLDLFEKYMYRSLDKWSYMTDDAKTLFEQHEGVQTTYGMGFALGEFDNQPGTYFAVVFYVYPNSPAKIAGVKRGDMIMKINNQPITENNYMELYNSPAISIQTAKIDENGKMTLTGESISMNAIKMYEDPVQEYKIIEHEDHKIGYLCYTDYVEGSHAKLKQIFKEFKNAGVKDLVLDLRYNLGGAVNTAQYLSSILVPAQVAAAKGIYLKEVWNSRYNEYWQSRGEEMNIRFLDTLQDYNLNLNRLYVLTTGNTASASEATIVGLKPYMDVVTIGEKTYGKYCAAALMQFEDDKGNVIPQIADWAMSLIIYKFANAHDLTDFTNGLPPVHPVEDDWKNYRQFGDESDPLLAAAISLITTGTRSMQPPTKRAVDTNLRLLDPDKQPLRRKSDMIHTNLPKL
jgi:C-terminal processing protease CtpA/Prc